MAALVAGLGLAVAVSSCATDGGMVEVADVWVRPTPPGAETAAFFMTIDNGSDEDDRLTGVESSVCQTTEIHDTAIVDDVMQMRPVDGGVDVPAGTEVVLESGGLHVMCIGAAPLLDGDAVDVTVRFAEAGTVNVTASIENR